MYAPAPTPSLVGRDRELATLRERLAAALAGNGGLVLIGGEAGIGKTALANVLCREATETGAHFLTGHCYDRTETPPSGPWIGIVRRVQSLPDAANGPQIPRLDTATHQAALFTQARDFLVALTAERPLVLVPPIAVRNSTGVIRSPSSYHYSCARRRPSGSACDHSIPRQPRRSYGHDTPSRNR